MPAVKGTLAAAFPKPAATGGKTGAGSAGTARPPTASLGASPPPARKGAKRTIIGLQAPQLNPQGSKSTIVGGLEPPVLGSAPLPKPPTAAAPPRPAPQRTTHSTLARLGKRVEPAEDRKWTVAISETDQREMTTAELVDAYASGVVDDETFLWREGMTDWAAPFEVDEVAAALRARNLSPAAGANKGAKPEHPAAPEATPQASAAGFDEDEATVVVRSPFDSPEARGEWHEPGQWKKQPIAPAGDRNVSFNDVTVALDKSETDELVRASLEAGTEDGPRAPTATGAPSPAAAALTPSKADAEPRGAGFEGVPKLSLEADDDDEVTRAMLSPYAAKDEEDASSTAARPSLAGRKVQPSIPGAQVNPQSTGAVAEDAVLFSAEQASRPPPAPSPAPHSERPLLPNVEEKAPAQKFVASHGASGPPPPLPKLEPAGPVGARSSAPPRLSVPEAPTARPKKKRTGLWLSLGLLVVVVGGVIAVGRLHRPPVVYEKLYGERGLVTKLVGILNRYTGWPRVPSEPAPAAPPPAPVIKPGPPDLPAFNRNAAVSELGKAVKALGKCSNGGAATGAGRATVTFAPTGKVVETQIAGPIAGSESERCVSQTLATVRVPPFSGGAVAVKKNFSLEISE